MTHADWLALLNPIAQAVVTGVAILLGALFSYAAVRLTAFLNAHGVAVDAQVEAAATARVQAGLMTGASVITGRIARGELDYLNRAAVVDAASHEVEMVMQRLPDAVAKLNPAPGALLASIMGKTDAQVVAAGLAPKPEPAVSGVKETTP